MPEQGIKAVSPYRASRQLSGKQSTEAWGLSVLSGQSLLPGKLAKVGTHARDGCRHSRPEASKESLAQARAPPSKPWMAQGRLITLFFILYKHFCLLVCLYTMCVPGA